jgi:pimeloyl-ACP methyl ester carboxylesterase
MERFLNAGYAVFSWDKPGTGASTGEFQDGSHILSDRAAILVDALNVIRQHPAIDAARIGLWGISQAGYVMPLALTQSDDIAFMIVVSGPGVDSIDQMGYLIGQQIRCQGATTADAALIQQSYVAARKALTYKDYYENQTVLGEFPAVAEYSSLSLLPKDAWSPWNREVDAFFNPITVIEQTAIPVLAFFGENDTQVDPIQGVAAYEAALAKTSHPQSHVELIPDVDHGLAFSETGCMYEQHNRSLAKWTNYAPEYLDLMETWLVQLTTSQK